MGNVYSQKTLGVTKLWLARVHEQFIFNRMMYPLAGSFISIYYTCQMYSSFELNQKEFVRMLRIWQKASLLLCLGMRRMLHQGSVVNTV